MENIIQFLFKTPKSQGHKKPHNLLKSETLKEVFQCELQHVNKLYRTAPEACSSPSHLSTVTPLFSLSETQCFQGLSFSIASFYTKVWALSTFISVIVSTFGMVKQNLLTESWRVFFLGFFVSSPRCQTLYVLWL